MLVVDTGVLLAAADEADKDHGSCLALLRLHEGELTTTPYVIAETAYLIGRQLGSQAEADFARMVANGLVEVAEFVPKELYRMAEVVETYADLPLGLTDASVVVLAERLRTGQVATLDHRHFSVVRPHHRTAFELLP